VSAQILEIGVSSNWDTVHAICSIAAGARSAECIVDQAVVVCLLDPFVDDGAGPGVDHFVAEDGCLVVEGAGGTDIATGLGEEDGNVVLRGVLLQEDVARGLVSGIAAPDTSQWWETLYVEEDLPLVGVQAIEIDSLGGILTASEIVLQHWTKTTDVCRCVANGDLAVALAYCQSVSERF
jgi:hypothetical protein